MPVLVLVLAQALAEEQLMRAQSHASLRYAQALAFGCCMHARLGSAVRPHPPTTHTHVRLGLQGYKTVKS